MRPRLTYANVMATIAVFIALGGASYAAINLPKDSVGTRQLKKNAVTATKIKKNAVRSADIKNEAVLGSDVLEKSLGKVPKAADARAAQVAQSAAEATNSQQLAGRGLNRIVGLAVGNASDPEPDTTLSTQLTSVVSVQQTLPEGTSDVVVQASLSFFGLPGGIADCVLELGSNFFFAPISTEARAAFPGASASSVQLSLVGFADSTGDGAHIARARCKASVGTVQYVSGNIVSQAVPE
jgi:hypothetical protein